MPELHDPPIPLSYAERMAAAAERSEARVEALDRKLDGYVADVAPAVKRLREIEEARDLVRIRTEAERLEGRSAIARVLTSKPAIAVYTAIAMAAGTVAADWFDIGPKRVQSEMSPPAEDEP